MLYVIERLGVEQIMYPSDFPHERARPEFLKDVPEFLARDDLPDSLFRESSGSIPNASPSASLEEVEREHVARVLAASTTLEEAADTLGLGLHTE